jgi:hypothetical protein
MSRSLIRKTQLHPDIADLVSGYGDQFFVSSGEVDSVLGTLYNYTPGFINITGNFLISGNNTKIIMANSPTLITGYITSGNITGYNTSIIQIGSGQIQITGSGVGIGISSYNNQYRTAGQFATISLLHTGNNRYIMYGNTSS